MIGKFTLFFLEHSSNGLLVIILSKEIFYCYFQYLCNLNECFYIRLGSVGTPLGNSGRIDTQLFGEPFVGTLMLNKHDLDSIDVFCHVA